MRGRKDRKQSWHGRWSGESEVTWEACWGDRRRRGIARSTGNGDPAVMKPDATKSLSQSQAGYRLSSEALYLEREKRQGPWVDNRGGGKCQGSCVECGPQEATDCGSGRTYPTCSLDSSDSAWIPL